MVPVSFTGRADVQFSVARHVPMLICYRIQLVAKAVFFSENFAQAAFSRARVVHRLGCHSRRGIN